MKPSNIFLGNDPLRTSRVNLIHLENAAFDSVVFQQGKSLLDFDLNVSQDVIKSMVEQIARSIFDKSGFLKPLNITAASGSISIDPFTVNLFGKISRLVGTGTNDKIGITFANTTYPKFIWLEMWYQEITPLDTIESVDETLAQSLSPGSNKLKTSRIIKYGGIPNASLSQNLENNLKDVNFGAETTRRVQFRWNIRATTSLSAVDSMGSSSVFAVGGRTLDTSWVESPTAINVFGTSGENNSYNFVKSNEYVSSADTSYIASLKNSLQEFALFNDENVYIAGRGTSDDAKTLNTIDGRVYAIPLGVISETYSFSKSSQATTPIGISTSGGTSSATVTIGSQGSLSFSNPSANISSGLLGTSPNTTPYITMDNISLKAGSLTAPAISYNDGSTIQQTGLYFSPTVSGSGHGINFGISGVNKFTILPSLATLGTSSTSVGLTINGALTVNNSAVTLPGVSITSVGAATINNLSSNNISITGGSITAGLSSNTQITGSVDAFAKFSANINNAVSDRDVRKIIFKSGTLASINEDSYDSSSKTLTLSFSGTNAFPTATSGTTIVYNQASLPGEIWQEGVLDTPARRDHRHARESFPSSSITIAQKSSGILASDSSIKGTSNNTVSRGDHTHQLPSYFGPTLISTDGTNYSSISSSATSLEIYGSSTTVDAGSPTVQLVVKDSSSTGNPSIGFFAQNSRWGGLYASKSGTASLFTLYGNASTSSNTLTTYATFDSTKADFPFGTSSKYFSANSGFGGGTSASRFIGAVSTKPTSSTNVNVGDFVIDTTGNIHIYGTKDSTNTWLTAGILTTANNSWTGVQNFGADISSYSTLTSSSNYSYGINIGKDGGTGYTIATPVSGTSGKFSAFYIGNAQISGTGTLADSYSIDLGGVPLRTSTAATVTNFGGMIIRQAATSVAAGGSGYGLRVYTPKGGDNSYGIKIEGPVVSGTNSYGLHVSASSGATNNYAIYVSGPSLFTGNVQLSNNVSLSGISSSGNIVNMAYITNENNIVYGDTSASGYANDTGIVINSGNVISSTGQDSGTPKSFYIVNNLKRYFVFSSGGLTIGEYANNYRTSESFESQGNWRLGTTTPYATQSSSNYYGGLGGSLNRSNNIYSLYFRDRSDTWWNQAYIEANDFSFRTNNFVDTSSIVSSGYATISGTIDTGGWTIYGLSIATEGLVPGMTLTKISGTGVLSGSTKIASFNSATGVITLSSQATTVGAITFSISSGFISGMRYLINTTGTTNWTSIGSSATTGYFTYNGAAVTGTGSAYELRKGPAQTKLYISNTGNVGIGTSSPAQPLDVAGNIRSTGEIITTSANGLRIGTTLFRNDGTNFYYLLGTSDTPGDNWGALRPLVINNSTGNVSVGGVTTTATFNVTGTVSGAVAPKMFIPAQGFNLPITASPAFYQNNSGSVKYELQYSGTEIQVAYTMVVVPSSYSSGPITFKLQWYTATENQKVAWNILVASSGNGETPNPTLTLLKQINSTANSAANMKYETFVWNSSVTELPLSGVSSGKMLYIGIQRNATDATNDTSTETVNFRSLIVEF